MTPSEGDVTPPQGADVSERELEALFPGLQGILPRLLRPIPARVYHYTPRTSGLQILESSSIWASSIRQLSGDPDEYETGLRFIQQRVLDIGKQFKRTDRKVFDVLSRWGYQWPRIKTHDRLVASFSEVRDSRTQWTNYGAGGYSFAFDAMSLNEMARPNNYMLTDCIYRRREHESISTALVDDALDVYQKAIAGGHDHEAAAMRSKILFEIPVSTIMPRLKKKKFKPEGEWRLVSVLPLQVRPAPGLTHRDVMGRDVPYEPIAFRANGTSALREIMIAPEVDYEPAKAELQKVLDRFGHSGIAITRSEIPAHG